MLRPDHSESLQVDISVHSILRFVHQGILTCSPYHTTTRLFLPFSYLNHLSFLLFLANQKFGGKSSPKPMILIESILFRIIASSSLCIMYFNIDTNMEINLLNLYKHLAYVLFCCD